MNWTLSLVHHLTHISILFHFQEIPAFICWQKSWRASKISDKKSQHNEWAYVDKFEGITFIVRKCSKKSRLNKSLKFWNKNCYVNPGDFCFISNVSRNNIVQLNSYVYTCTVSKWMLPYWMLPYCSQNCMLVQTELMFSFTKDKLKQTHP